jgi:uncharacterized protein YjeT (DUF2065 family)
MMTQRKNPQLLNVALILFAVVTLVNGLAYLFIPEIYLKLTGSQPIPPAWIRWSGGILISLGIGAIMVFRNPGKQGIFVKMAALGTLIVGLTNLYEIFFESVGDVWFSLPNAIVNFILSALLWISLKQAKAILWDEGE